MDPAARISAWWQCGIAHMENERWLITLEQLKSYACAATVAGRVN